MVAVALALLAGQVLAGSTGGVDVNDAGTGADAGSSRELAVLLPTYGSYSATYFPSDTDWFSIQDTRTVPTCNSFELSGPRASNASFHVERAGSSKSVNVTASPNGTVTGGRAVPAYDRVSLAVEAAPIGPSSLSTYIFTLARTGIPSLAAGDALSGVDAGADLAGAVPVTRPCFGGHLIQNASVSDTVDSYRLQLVSGTLFAYSLATPASENVVRLVLRDANGNAIGPTIGSGGMAGVTVPTTGDYLLSATATSTSVADAAYVIGSIVGPEPPTTGCRPNCEY